MKYSVVREKHEREVLEAFERAGCVFFPNSKSIRKWNGPAMTVELAKTGHTAMAYTNCECQKLVTISCEEEWNNFRSE